MRPDRVDRITSADVGCRVVVRYHVQDGGLATDVLGRLEAWSDGILSVRRSDGSTVHVNALDVVAAKPIPPRSVARRDVRALETAAARGWQALDTSRIGGWLLRAASGFTGRANSCLPLSSPGRPLARVVIEVERWYEARGLRPAFQIPEPLGAGLDEHLDGAGWPRSTEDVLVMVASVDAVAAVSRSDLPPVAVASQPDANWLAAYHYRGAGLPPNAVRVLVNAETVGFGSVDQGGRRVAIARGAVSDAPDGRRWLGLTAVEVASDARRRGLGRHVMAGVAQWARRHGATDVYVQVAEPNTAALATHLRLGFVEHHRYHYRRRTHSRS
ncbi:MAG TPA: GNAT family N-acetyltransferase [Jiangellaceae bacterium]|nr:GNAT family N-acetyltransferase [Jiangellaceae bacterium]